MSVGRSGRRRDRGRRPSGRTSPVEGLPPGFGAGAARAGGLRHRRRLLGLPDLRRRLRHAAEPGGAGDARRLPAAARLRAARQPQGDDAGRAGVVLGARRRSASAPGVYNWVFYAELIRRCGFLTTADLVVGTLLIVLVFEAARRLMGWPLAVIAGDLPRLLLLRPAPAAAVHPPRLRLRADRRDTSPSAPRASTARRSTSRRPTSSSSCSSPPSSRRPG